MTAYVVNSHFYLLRIKLILWVYIVYFFLPFFFKNKAYFMGVYSLWGYIVYLFFEMHKT